MFANSPTYKIVFPMFRGPNVGSKPTVCAPSTTAHFCVTSRQFGRTGTNMKLMLTTVP